MRPRLTVTRTYVHLPLSQPAYDEIAAELREAGYDHAFRSDGSIDMHGIAVVPEGPTENGQPPDRPWAGPRD